MYVSFCSSILCGWYDGKQLYSFKSYRNPILHRATHIIISHVLKIIKDADSIYQYFQNVLCNCSVNCIHKRLESVYSNFVICTYNDFTLYSLTLFHKFLLRTNDNSFSIIDSRQFSLQDNITLQQRLESEQKCVRDVIVSRI